MNDFSRQRFADIEQALTEFPAVALLGPRQIGKSTLALAVADAHPGAVWLDLETQEDRRKLAEPAEYLARHADRLVVLDEIHRAPELFTELRAQIDQRRRRGRRVGHFLILGSAALALLKQSSESLAGRVCFIELESLRPIEVGESPASLRNLWLRGGFPDSLRANSDAASLRYRRALIRSYLERDIPQFGVRISPTSLERFWTMLAHVQGGILNAQRLATSLGVSWHTISSYLDLMVDLFLLRRLPPWHHNAGKRLVKSPKLYLRDSGLVHALLDIRTDEQLLGHPVAGFSWEGFALENLLAEVPNAHASFYRTATGHEIDLVLSHAGRRIAIDVKRSRAPQIEPGFLRGCDAIEADERWLVHGGDERFPVGHGVEARPLAEACAALRALA